MNLHGKTLFITGASRGIGLAIAGRAARDGANIVIAAKTAETNPKLPGTIYSAALEVEAAGGHALALQCDIRNEASVQAAVEQAVARFGGIDILVNNASAISLTDTPSTPMKRFDLMFGVNVRGTLVQGAHRLHDGQVRHEHVHAGPRGRVPPPRHRRQQPVAAHGDRHRGAADDPRRGHRQVPHAADPGRRRLPDPDQPTSTTRCWPSAARPTSSATASRRARRT